MSKKTNKKALLLLISLPLILVSIIGIILSSALISKAADTPENAPTKYLKRTISQACDSSDYDSFVNQIANSSTSYIAGTARNVLIKETRTNGIGCKTDTVYIHKDFYLQAPNLKVALPQQQAAWQVIIKHLTELKKSNNDSSIQNNIDFIQKQISICSASSFFDTAYKNYFILPDGPSIVDKLKPLMSTPSGIVIKKSDTEILVLKQIVPAKLTTDEQNTFNTTDGRLAWQTLANAYNTLTTSLSTCVYPTDANVAKSSQQAIVTLMKTLVTSCSNPDNPNNPFIYDDQTQSSNFKQYFEITMTKTIKFGSTAELFPMWKGNSSNTIRLPKTLSDNDLITDQEKTSFAKYQSDWSEVRKLYVTIMDKANICNINGFQAIKSDYDAAKASIGYIDKKYGGILEDWRTKLEGVYVTYNSESIFNVDSYDTLLTADEVKKTELGAETAKLQGDGTGKVVGGIMRLPYVMSSSNVKGLDISTNVDGWKVIQKLYEIISQRLESASQDTSGKYLIDITTGLYKQDYENAKKSAIAIATALKKAVGIETVLNMPATANQGAKVTISGKIEKTYGDEICALFIGDGNGTYWKKPIDPTKCTYTWQTDSNTKTGWHGVILVADYAQSRLPDSFPANGTETDSVGTYDVNIAKVLKDDQYAQKTINICGKSGCSAVPNISLTVRTQEHSATDDKWETETSNKAVKQWGKVNLSATLTSTDEDSKNKQCRFYIGGGDGVLYLKETTSLDLNNSCSYSWQTQAGQPNGTALGTHKILVTFSDKDNQSALPSAWDYVNICDNNSTGSCTAPNDKSGSTNANGETTIKDNDNNDDNSGPPGTLTPDEITGLAGIKLGSIKEILLDSVTRTWFPIAIGIAAFFALIFGGFTYITSAGDPKNAERGKSILTKTIIGIVIALGAYVIIYTVMSILHKIGVINY